MNIRQYNAADIKAMQVLWNDIVEKGNAFPQEEPMTLEEATQFFAAQSYAGVADDGGEVVGFYILHPNNVGRCGHLANASYAVKASRRGQHIGEMLVKDCITVARSLAFRVLQFNAVVASNHAAIHLYKKLGFKPLGTVPGGFRLRDGNYEDIIPFYITLV